MFVVERPPRGAGGGIREEYGSRDPKIIIN